MEDDQVWMPRTTAALALVTGQGHDSVFSPSHHSNSQDQSPGHRGYYTLDPKYGYRDQNGGREATIIPIHYGTYSPTRHKPDTNHLTSFGNAPYSEGTWPRSGSGGDPYRTSHLALSPTQGLSLHTIREHESGSHSNLPGGQSGQSSPHPSSPPSMTNGMSTTVPQSMVQHNLNCSHRPHGGRHRGSTLARLTSPQNKETLEMRCCRITVLLVIMQMCLGSTITALAFYMERLTTAFAMRECPYWAGIPLLIAGVIGLYHCATDFAVYAGSMKAFLIKATCICLSTVCVFLCMVAAIFPGIHGHRIPSYSTCEFNMSNLTCLCTQTWGEYFRQYTYTDMEECTTIGTSVKDFLILQCALNAIASGVCLWFVTLLWKKRYEDFHSGLRFYSYSASVPPHPWSDPSNPPYFKTQEPEDPPTVGTLTLRAKSQDRDPSHKLTPGHSTGEALNTDPT